MEQSQQMKKLDMLKLEKEKLLEEWVLLKHHLGELKVLSKDQEETSDLQNEQQQEQQRMEERLQSLLKQRELVTQQMNLAIKLQHHLTVSQMRSETLLHELEQSTAQDESVLPTELLQQEH
ncbi:nucleoporin GLE1-like [Peromyscus leucopus]|uniref:nucleoporin GLE1-like n=1 Tax=Peromyscus leucopus TaxID=10041 RepID=UPI0010A11676|nr:nucleoporin GLE1-like [Peromyscus leucopus]